MKNLSKYAFILFFTLYCVSGSGQKFTDAYSYINYINTQYSKVMEDMWSYTSAVAHGKNARKIEAKRNELINTTLKTKENIAKMPAFQDDQNLRDSTVYYLGLGHSILINDYSAIVDMEAVAEQSYDQMEAYILAQEKANEKLDLAGKRLEREQKEFALKFHMTLVEGKDKVGNNLEKANRAFAYYNKVYLLFFKCHKQDMYLSDALNKSDINAVDQNKNALLKFSNEGMKQLDTLKNIMPPITRFLQKRSFG
jgi:hypothetical protein